MAGLIFDQKDLNEAVELLLHKRGIKGTFTSMWHSYTSPTDPSDAIFEVILRPHDNADTREVQDHKV